MFETADYRVRVRQVLDEATLQIEIPVCEMTDDPSRWAGLNELVGVGYLANLFEVRLLGLTRTEDPARAARIQERLRAALPEGTSVLLRTSCREMTSGGTWEGAVYLDLQGHGMPVNIQVLLPAPVAV